jgi:hypothetical protein
VRCPVCGLAIGRHREDDARRCYRAFLFRLARRPELYDDVPASPSWARYS